MNSILGRRRRRPGEAFLLAAVYGAAYLSLFLLLGMIGYLFSKGFRKLSLDFFTSVTSALKGTVGIGGNLVNTLYIIVMALAVSVPLGVGTAVFLNEYMGSGRTAKLIEFAMNTLSGIPSVIFGLFGMVFFGDILGLGYCLLSGSLTLGLAVLPLIAKNTQEALRAVPESFRSGALGMGATKWYMIRTILLPCARPGILTGVTLAVGRIVGESAALLFTAGSARSLPRLGRGIGGILRGLRDKIFDSGGTLTIELYLQVQRGEFGTAFAISCVLLMIVLAVNLLLRIAGGGKGGKWGDRHEKGQDIGVGTESSLRQ